MLNRPTFRIIPPALILALLSTLAIYKADAQDPPRPPEPKQPPQQKDARDKNGERRQAMQADEQTVDKGAVIKIDTDMVNLDVTVIDQNNTPIANLKKEDFSVYEDKVKQTIESVSREEVPVSFGLAIDTSGSMRSKLQSVSDAAVLLIKQMRRDDEAFIASFKAEAELAQEFTTSRRELEAALGNLYTSGGTALLDAIIATADHAQEKGKRRRKALVVITDGLDKNSSAKEKKVIDVMKEDEVQVYLVGFVDEKNSGGFFGGSPAKKAKALLIRLAEDSGGRAFFPTDVREMPAIAAQIAKDLRTQYVVSYYPNNDRRDGSFHTVRVVVSHRDNRKLIARTRQGYYARNDKGAPQGAGERRPQ